MSEPDLTFIAHKLGQAENFLVEIDPLTAFTLVGLIQLALRHPAMSDRPSATICQALGSQLQEALGLIDPSISEALELGWNPDLDVSRDEFDQSYPF